MESDTHLLDSRGVEATYGPQLSEAKLRNMRWKGIGPAYVKMSKRVLYTPASIRRWLEDCTVDPATAAKPKN